MTVTGQSGYQSHFPGFYQVAYVSNDLDAAVDQASRTYGITEWFRMSGFAIPMASGNDGLIDVAVANLGDTQFELIAPAGGDDGIYRDCLRADGRFQVVFHHLCQAFDTEDDFRANRAVLQNRGIALPIDNTDLPPNGTVLVCYADVRDTFGHYLEYVWYTDAGRQWLDGIPRNG